MRITFFTLCCFFSIAGSAQIKSDSLLNSDSVAYIKSDTIPLIKSDTVAFTKKDTLTIIGVGDIMMGTNYPEDKLQRRRGRELHRQHHGKGFARSPRKYAQRLREREVPYHGERELLSPEFHRLA